MKPSVLIIAITLSFLLFLFGLAVVSANRIVEREYDHRERNTSSVVSIINQYNESTTPNRGGMFGSTAVNVLFAIFALTGLFTAVSMAVGKGGVNGLVRQLKANRRARRPAPQPTAVNTAAPLPVNAYPVREPVHALTANTPAEEADEIQWV